MQRHNADVAMNNWVENTYKNYVKNEMATPEDRVRQMFDRRSLDVNKLEVKYDQDIEKLEKKLAKAQDLPKTAENDQRIAYIKRDIENKIDQKEIDVSTARQTIGHDKELANEANFLGAGTRGARVQGGFPEEGMATSEVGRGWENLADNLIGIKQAKNISRDPDLAKRYPWVEQLTKLLSVPLTLTVRRLRRCVRRFLKTPRAFLPLRNIQKATSGLSLQIQKQCLKIMPCQKG
jgi:hypothetical protein